jgi:hypothetical protein
MVDTILKLLHIAAQLAQIFTVIGIVLLYRQIQNNRKTTQAQLINDLEREFSSYYSVFSKLKIGGSWYELCQLENREICDLEMLVVYCEKLKHFLNRGLLDWPTLDLMFRHRFFTIMQNANVREHVIKPHSYDWKALIELRDEWSKRLPSTDPRRI